IEAIVGAAELGARRKVYVLGPNGPEERDVTVGASNDSKVEVKAGLLEGDRVVLNPKAIIGDKAKTRQPGGGKNRGGDGENGEGGNGKGKGKAGPPGPGGPGPEPA